MGENKKKKVMIADLERKNFDPDPVKRWKATQAKLEAAQMEDAAPADADSDSDEDLKAADFDYLLGMAMLSLTQEKIDDLLKKKGDKHKELKLLKEKSPSMLWDDDLDEFLEKLQEVEDKEIADQAESKPAKGAKGKKKTFKQETMASPNGIRVAVKIPDELRKKVVAAMAAKNRKASK